ncbi:24959_t:CDS:2, partial [Racocetra persica]
LLINKDNQDDIYMIDLLENIQIIEENSSFVSINEVVESESSQLDFLFIERELKLIVIELLDIEYSNAALLHINLSNPKSLSGVRITSICGKHTHSMIQDLHVFAPKYCRLSNEMLERIKFYVTKGNM